MLSKLGVAYRHAIPDGIPKRSFYVAMVVGTVLNLINQGEVLFGASSINWVRWSRFLRQAVKVDLLTKRMIHHEDTQTVYS